MSQSYAKVALRHIAIFWGDYLLIGRWPIVTAHQQIDIAVRPTHTVAEIK